MQKQLSIVSINENSLQMRRSNHRMAHLVMAKVMPIVMLTLFLSTPSVKAETTQQSSANEVSEKEGTTVVFPDFSALRDESDRPDERAPEDGRAGAKQKKSGQNDYASSCKHGGHVYLSTDVMYASCVAERDSQTGRPAARKSKGSSSGEARIF